MAENKTLLNNNPIAQKCGATYENHQGMNDLGSETVFHFKKNHFIFHSESNFLFLKLHIQL